MHGSSLKITIMQWPIDKGSEPDPYPYKGKECTTLKCEIWNFTQNIIFGLYSPFRKNVARFEISRFRVAHASPLYW